ALSALSLHDALPILTFDISIWQMLAPLVAGGRVRVVSRDRAADPRELFGHAAEEGVTILEVVPSLLRAALDAWDEDGVAPALPRSEEHTSELQSGAK